MDEEYPPLPSSPAKPPRAVPPPQPKHALQATRDFDTEMTEISTTDGATGDTVYTSAETTGQVREASTTPEKAGVVDVTDSWHRHTHGGV